MPIDLDRLDRLCRGLGATDTLGVQVRDVHHIIGEIRELRADRERLDWLETHTDVQIERYFHSQTTSFTVVLDCEADYSAASLRAAIDAARVPPLAEERKTNDAK